MGKIKVVALDEITHRVGGKRRYTLAAQDAKRGEWLAMRVSQSRDEEAWVALLDELWEIEISPDSGVEWVVCDGDLAIEGAVEIAYPGVRIQRCISHGDPVGMAPPQERSIVVGEEISPPERG